MILVPLFYLTFLVELAAGGAGTTNRRHWHSIFPVGPLVRNCRWGDLIAAIKQVVPTEGPQGAAPLTATSQQLDTSQAEDGVRIAFP